MVFYNKLKQELKKDKSLRSISIYLMLIVQERDLDEILEYVKENPGAIEEYANMLQEKYKDEVIQIYKKYIKAAAGSSSKRRQYQGVCGIIMRYKKIAGKKSQEGIISELIALYRNRPAFLDELSKIK